MFLDGGNVWRNRSDLSLRSFLPYGLRGTESWSRFRYTAGGGIRVNTPVGPFRIDYGVKLNPPELPATLPVGATAPSKTNWHLSLGQAY